MGNDDKYKKALEQREKQQEGNNLGKVVTESQKKAQEIERKKQIALEKLNERRSSVNNVFTPVGYTNILLKHLHSKGKFYPADAIIQIRSANIEEVEHWSTMRDIDPVDESKHLNDILKTCCIVQSQSNPNFGVNDLIVGDRMLIILKIKELTYPETEHVINLNIGCPKCGTEYVEELKTTILDAKASLEDKYEKYYDPIKRAYILKTKSFGEMCMRPPRVGIMQYVYEEGRKKHMRKEFWDKGFYQTLPFMYDKFGPIDETYIKNLHNKFKSWTNKQFSIYYRVAEKMDIGTQAYIKKDCTKTGCGEVIETPFRIPNGTKSIFIVSNIDDELI